MYIVYITVFVLFCTDPCFITHTLHSEFISLYDERGIEIFMRRIDLEISVSSIESTSCMSALPTRTETDSNAKSVVKTSRFHYFTSTK